MVTGVDKQLLLIRDNVVGSDDTICSSEACPAFSCLEYITILFETIKEEIAATKRPLKYLLVYQQKSSESISFCLLYKTLLTVCCNSGWFLALE